MLVGRVVFMVVSYLLIVHLQRGQRSERAGPRDGFRGPMCAWEGGAMSRKERTIVVIGGGGHAKVLISVLRKLPWTSPATRTPATSASSWALPAWATTACFRTCSRPPRLRGDHGRGQGRRLVAARRAPGQLESLGYQFPVIVSPDAVVNIEVELGAGTVVFDGAVVNTGVTTGAACIVNTNATLEHDCRLGDNVHIAPGATVSGGVTIGSHSFVGAGAVVIHGVRIADGCLIGAGAVVTADIAVPGTYAGVPPGGSVERDGAPRGDPRPGRLEAGPAQERAAHAGPAAARLHGRGGRRERPLRPGGRDDGQRRDRRDRPGHGAEVPFLRDPALADDMTPVSRATIDVLERLGPAGQAYEQVCQLMPNCPLRTADDVVASHRQFVETRPRRRSRSCATAGRTPGGRCAARPT